MAARTPLLQRCKTFPSPMQKGRCCAPHEVPRSSTVASLPKDGAFHAILSFVRSVEHTIEDLSCGHPGHVGAVSPKCSLRRRGTPLRTVDTDRPEHVRRCNPRISCVVSRLALSNRLSSAAPCCAGPIRAAVCRSAHQASLAANKYPSGDPACHGQSGGRRMRAPRRLSALPTKTSSFGIGLRGRGVFATIMGRENVHACAAQGRPLTRRQRGGFIHVAAQEQKCECKSGASSRYRGSRSDVALLPGSLYI
ncbi:hypothetical protein OH76DRAFT_630680 [Lentinus brumalis]|uniref:Uncharacterized protein n=1 Tax=Lentinus brumalis TaxID=2498619 RepID=A0A371D8F8_9APHY|nr:hypothetical protein OH76DRAFT_630680 [Polyporus brumalis]